MVLIPGFLTAQLRTSDFDLVGKVESVSSVTYPFGTVGKTTVSGFLDSESFDSVFMSFDRRRNLVLKENYLDYRGVLGLFDRTVYKINPSNRIEESQTTLIQNGEGLSKTAQKRNYYYLGESLIRMDEFNSGRTGDQYWVTSYIYDKGDLAEKVFWMEDEIFSRNLYEHDANHNPLSEKTIFNNGRTGKQIRYENDSSGSPEKIIESAGNEQEVRLIKYENRRQSEIKTTDKSGRALRIERYDDTGRIREIEKFNHQTQKTDLFVFHFTPDLHRNWIRCEITRNGTPVYLVERRIKYY